MKIGFKESFSRRDFLKYSTLASAGVIFDFRDNKGASYAHLNEQNSDILGRVFEDNTASYREPDITSSPTSFFNQNEVLRLQEMIANNANQPVNEVWYRLEDGSFIHSNVIQPVKNQLNAPRSEINSNGQLAEISVPYTDAWSRSNNADSSNRIFFFGSTHWIYGLGEDKQKNLYYLVIEDRWNNGYYVDATHMRLIEEDELSPISELVPLDDKLIHINLQQQIMVAYEKDEPVFISALASGQQTSGTDFSTPPGEYLINYKRPSRHMDHSDLTGANGDELYGVPWVSYFTETGIAFHGTYWHNNFTRPRSHGCINLPIPAARWVYRWTQPVVPPREQKYVSRYGTRVVVS